MKNKNGVMAVSEAFVMLLSIVCLSFIMYFTFSLSLENKSNFEQATPELSYEFPKTVVYSFMNIPLSEEDNEKYFNDKNGHYTISDLIWLDSDEGNIKISEYRNNFISGSGIKNVIFDFENSLSLYNNFQKSNQKKDYEFKKIDEDNLLYIYRFSEDGSRTDINSKYDKPVIYNKNDFILYSKTSKDDLVAIFFNGGN